MANEVEICGVVKEIEIAHKIGNLQFYKIVIETGTKNKAPERLKVVVEDKDISLFQVDEPVHLKCELKSYTYHYNNENGEKRIKKIAFISFVEKLEELGDLLNLVTFYGQIIQPPHEISTHDGSGLYLVRMHELEGRTPEKPAYVNATILKNRCKVELEKLDRLHIIGYLGMNKVKINDGLTIENVEIRATKLIKE